MKQQSYLDFLAQMGISSAHPGGFVLTKAILDREALTSEIEVLDVGCGTGRTSEYIANTYHSHVTALDAHPVMLEKAAKRFEKCPYPIKLVEGNVEELPFSDNSFDMIIAESVTAFTNIPVTLSEYYRVLKPGGKLIDIEMTSEMKLIPEAIEEIKQLYGTKQVLTESEWTELFGKIGYTNLVSYKGENLDKNAEKPEANVDASQFLFSETLDLENFKVWLNHVTLMNKYQNVLKYRVYRANKHNQ